MDEKVEQSLVKASKAYADNIPLRVGIQFIPCLGGSLDTLLSGIGVKVQNERFGYTGQNEHSFW